MTGDYWGQVFFMEMIGTFFFVALVCSVKYVNGSEQIIFNAMGVGLCLYGMISLLGPTTGACLNPAVALV